MGTTITPEDTVEVSQFLLASVRGRTYEEVKPLFDDDPNRFRAVPHGARAGWGTATVRLDASGRYAVVTTNFDSSD